MDAPPNTSAVWNDLCPPAAALTDDCGADETHMLVQRRGTGAEATVGLIYPPEVAECRSFKAAPPDRRSKAPPGSYSWVPASTGEPLVSFHRS